LGYKIKEMAGYNNEPLKVISLAFKEMDKAEFASLMEQF